MDTDICDFKINGEAASSTCRCRAWPGIMSKNA